MIKPIHLCKTISIYSHCPLGTPNIYIWIKPITALFTAASTTFTETAEPNKLQIINIINLPNFVKNINSRLLQQDIFNEGTWNGNLFSAGMNQVLSDVGFFHHIGTKVLSSIDHGLQQRLQCSTVRGRG